MLTHDFASTEQPPPSPPYAVFDDVMCAPITWLGESRGVLGVCSREAGRFDAAVESFCEAGFPCVAPKASMYLWLPLPSSGRAIGLNTSGSVSDSESKNLFVKDKKGRLFLITAKDETVTYPTGTVVRNLCDSLLTAKPDFTLEPNLATFEVKSPTQIVYTINQDAKFWDYVTHAAQFMVNSFE